jgi:dienelactone hydrolase
MRIGLLWSLLVAIAPLSVYAQVRQLAVSEGQVSGELYVPARVPAPGVFVLHTACGRVEPGDRAMAKALAEAGFVGFAINYPSGGNAGTWVPTFVRWLAARPEVGEQPMGAVGFSLGGSRVYNFAQSPRVKAVVAFYGSYDLAASPIAKFRGLAAGSPILQVDKMHAAALMLHGEKDSEAPPDQANRMKAALQARGLPVEVVIYPGAYHGFDRGPECGSDVTPNGTVLKHDPAAERDSFARTVAWFKTSLK